MRHLGRFTEDRARFYAAEVLLAYEALHSKRIIYRDLKPENVLLDENGHIKLADFNLSKMAEGNIMRTYTFCGTPEYISPEVLRGESQSKAVDFWSLVC
jgi:serum/glucocorticoid-regulated kinase 2